MTISYAWLSEYFPDNLADSPSPEELSHILTSIGLEVESLSPYESVKGSLAGIVVGEVMDCVPHPNADKLRLTKVSVGSPGLLPIVCGAPNVATGQKVVVALPGTTLYPLAGEPLTIKATKIRGEESRGMLCAEDEIGLGKSHAGIIVLPPDLIPGTAAAVYFKPFTDYIYEIGLTPNHMDAMSHFGVARDVCAWLSHRDNKTYTAKHPVFAERGAEAKRLTVPVSLENPACGRYSGVSITGITVGESPAWIRDRLKAVGVRPISNVVDITNFVLQEYGQPLHAYDAAALKGPEIIVRTLPGGTRFVTLDEKERVLDGEDLMVCDAEKPVCIAGVFGVLNSGVKSGTTEIFLESAWFDPGSIRRTALRHNLRTDASSHFEKGMDISMTVRALKRAAELICVYAGGKIASDITDVYPVPFTAEPISLSYKYLDKLSGKKYSPETTRNILLNLGFTIREETLAGLTVTAPLHKPDMKQPADLVEEIMRIDGLDNIVIPKSIQITPSPDSGRAAARLQEKTAAYLTGAGFYEIFTNSITNSAYFSAEELATSVRLLNNLSEELNLMRPSLLETGLESIAFNINRKNADLLFFEFGKSYHQEAPGIYRERNHACLYLTGNVQPASWKDKARPVTTSYLRGICESLLAITGAEGETVFETGPKLKAGFSVKKKKKTVLEAGSVDPAILARFDIRQPVFFADFNWDVVVQEATAAQVVFEELPRQLPVSRDLALVVEKSLPFANVEKAFRSIGLTKLRQVELFDIFESDRLGAGKKSFAVSLTFLDPEKTLTDKEIEAMMKRIMQTAETELKAEIRK